MRSGDVKIGEVTYNGLFIYPDDYSGDEVSSSSTWEAINAAGIVFLPCAGYRNGASVLNVGTYGSYWSSTPGGSTAWGMYFNSGSVGTGSFGRNLGFTVRPVR